VQLDKTANTLVFNDDVVLNAEIMIFRRDIGSDERLPSYDPLKWCSEEMYAKYALLLLETSDILHEEMAHIVPDAGSRARRLLVAHHDDFAAMCRMCDLFGIEVDRRRLMVEVGV
jgi:hypothetical protein